MIRYGSALLIATSACLTVAVVAACGDDSVGSSHPPASTGGSTSAGGAMGTGNTAGSGTGATDTGGGGSGTTPGVADKCDGMCCPMDATCYSSSAGVSAPGAACMARTQNTKDHIQLRQTWINITAPQGNTIGPVLQTLNTYTQFLEPACNTPKGASGYMQALDLDLTAGVSTLGYVKYGTASDTLANGLCFVDVGMGADTSATKTAGWKDINTYVAGGTAPDEKDFDFSLPPEQMSPATGWPDGLPAPMAQPWKMGPTKAKKLDADFNLATERETLLKRLKSDGDLGMAGFSGVFYYDTATGTSHGYSPVSYQVIYDAPAKAGDAPTTYILVPIREAEIKYRTNDPNSPNCVGKYIPGNVDPAAGCADTGLAENTKPGWGGIYDTAVGHGDAAVVGYFLITELEQVYSSVLRMTLCVSYPTLGTSMDNGWATDTEKRCRKAKNADGSAKWNPSDPVNGIPKGDWCAKTNSAATADCHDAYQSKSFHAFQAYKVKTDHCSVL